jgi:hypothetical protein
MTTSLPANCQVYIKRKGLLTWDARLVDKNGHTEWSWSCLTRRGAIRNVIRRYENEKKGWQRVL